ncbi:hypothetical protein [Achromobacter xylosoxidans]|uniref:Uncharacterized protein n=1 Tax=Alcaligenes xylosoxydans xylosoxydans TaxID=85698 RepID=A0A424W542_ALCXX|nr:hypothetical protein [Achromobacter xylosoxidans]MBC9904787.1 hypothetical protein [Achromobacter xylosoxidans]MBD0868704.1 hypothetical protein [Achromobacter xylosoxidans]QNP87793.1 hypothetical protein IAG39_09905 [Achromobacter xylosoxidans]RPJ88432.1 hypothetical protein DY367_27890 [Achromobacter xylosoxidans]
MLLIAELDDAEVDAHRGNIASIQKQIRSKQSPTPPFIYGCIAAAVAWYFQATHPVIVVAAVSAASLGILARSIDLAILEARLQGEQTRLAIRIAMSRFT